MLTKMLPTATLTLTTSHVLKPVVNALRSEQVLPSNMSN